MRRHLAAVCLLVLLSGSISAQIIDNVAWCPPGASWVYNRVSFGSLSYFHIYYVKDTLIQGRQVKQMQPKIINFIGVGTLSRVEYVLEKEYMYNSHDSVFLLDTSFKFVYNFNPQNGDKWITGTSKYHSCPGNPIAPGLDTFNVYGFDSLVYGGRKFRLIKDSSVHKNYRLGNLLKNIGPMASPFPVLEPVRCFPPGQTVDMPFIYSLVCYKDDVRGNVLVNPGDTYDCHAIITSIQEPVEKSGFGIYPNPVQNTLTLAHVQPARATYCITSIAGILYMKGKLVQNEINVSGLPPGFYMISIEEKGRTSHSRFLKK